MWLLIGDVGLLKLRSRLIGDEGRLDMDWFLGAWEFGGVVIEWRAILFLLMVVGKMVLIDWNFVTGY